MIWFPKVSGSESANRPGNPFETVGTVFKEPVGGVPVLADGHDTGEMSRLERMNFRS